MVQTKALCCGKLNLLDCSNTPIDVFRYSFEGTKYVEIWITLQIPHRFSQMFASLLQGQFLTDDLFVELDHQEGNEKPSDAKETKLRQLRNSQRFDR